MTIATGSLITAADYNALATLINKVYDDIYSGATPVDPTTNASTIANYKFGWGGTAVTAVSIGELITDEQLNNIICRANIGVDITNNTPTNLTYVDQHMLITAADWTTVDAVLNLLITNKNNMDPTEQTVTSPQTAGNGVSKTVRTTAWGAAPAATAILDCVFDVDFTSYDKARHFFNSGGQHHILGYGSGGSTVAYGQWITLFSQLGTVAITLDNTTQTGTGGTSTNKGFYDCIVGDPTNLSAAEWTLLFTSGSGSGAYGSYGSYSGAYGCYAAYAAYGGYASLGLRIYGMLSTTGDKFHIKVTLDNTALCTTVDGTTTIEVQERKLNNQTCTTTTTVSTPFTVNLTPYDPQYSIGNALE